MILRVIGVILLLIVGGCATTPPNNVNDICSVFRQKKGWYDAAADSRDKWGSPIAVMMAMMHQESTFRAKAKPPRKKIFGLIPGPRPSNAYGYSQALDSTWKNYKRSAGRYGADRDDFNDAIDFIGWYNDQSSRRSKISKSDAYNLYLAYHEGQGGFNRKTYRSKKWLIKVARKVQGQSKKYQSQLNGCEKSLKKKRGIFGLFG